MTAPDTAELMKLCDDELSANIDGVPTRMNAVHIIARALKSLLSSPTDAEVGEIQKRHDSEDVNTNDGEETAVAYVQAYRDRRALLRKLRERALTSDLSSDTSPQKPAES